MSAAVEGRVHITHPDIPGSSALVSDNEGVVAMYVAKGWVVDEAGVPAHLDPDAPNLETPPASEAPAVDEGGAADEPPAPAPAPISPGKASANDKTGEVTRG